MLSEPLAEVRPVRRGRDGRFDGRRSVTLGSDPVTELDGHRRPSGPPIGLPRAGARLLGPLARLSGYPLDLERAYERAFR